MELAGMAGGVVGARRRASAAADGAENVGGTAAGAPGRRVCQMCENPYLKSLTVEELTRKCHSCLTPFPA